MIKTLSRIGLTGALAAALLGGSLLTAPAASAAPASSHVKAATESFKVGSHRDTITLAPIGKKTKKVSVGDSSTRVALKYKVSIKRKGHVLYAKTTTTWRALLASTNVFVGSYKSDAQVVKLVKRSIALPEKEAKAGVVATSEQLGNELEAYGGAGAIVYDIQQWLTEQPQAPADLSGYTLPKEYTGVVGEGLGVSFSVLGTPDAYKVVATIKANGATISVDQSGREHFSKSSLFGHLLKNKLRAA